MRFRRARSSWLRFTYLLLVLGRYGDVTVPSLFGRPINLYWDGAQIPRFLWVSAQEWAWWKSLGLVLLIGFFFWGLFSLLQRAIAVSARDAVPYALRTRWVWVRDGLGRAARGRQSGRCARDLAAGFQAGHPDLLAAGEAAGSEFFQGQAGGSAARGDGG